MIFGCASVSAGDSFLVQKLDDQSKSQALTIAGIEEYDLHVVRKQEFDQIPRIKEYFTVALSFDPVQHAGAAVPRADRQLQDQKLCRPI